MVNGVLVITGGTWSRPEVEITYPTECYVSDDEFDQIYLFFNQVGRQKPISFGEFYSGERCFLLVGNYRQESRDCNEVIVLVLPERERLTVDSIRMLFYYFAKHIMKKSKEERAEYVSDNIFLFFPRKKEKKLVLVGRAGSGKTTIRSIVFEGKKPLDYLAVPAEPTRGVEAFVYTWFDLQAGVFDTSGQDFDKLLNDDQMQESLFDSVDFLVFVVDVSRWPEQEGIIIADLERIEEIRRFHGSESKMFLFLHKIDLLPVDKRNEFLIRLNERINHHFDGDVFLTSVHPDHLFSVHSAFAAILSFSSSEARMLKLILDESIAPFQKTMLCISNEKGMIVAQAASIDFNLTRANYFQKLAGQILLNLEEARPHDKVMHVTLETETRFTMMIENTSFNHSHLGNVICFSETLTVDMAKDVVQKMIGHLNVLYTNPRDEHMLNRGNVGE